MPTRGKSDRRCYTTPGDMIEGTGAACHKKFVCFMR